MTEVGRNGENASDQLHTVMSDMTHKVFHDRKVGPLILALNTFLKDMKTRRTRRWQLWTQRTFQILRQP